MPRRWVLPQCRPEDVAALSSSLSIGALAAKVMVHRGLADPAAARRFLQPSLDELNDPMLLKSMPEAVTRLREAIDRNQKILIYGDYDVDGTASVVLLT